MKIIRSIFNFIKKETVLCIAGVLAIASSFVVKPSAKYIEYIDFHVLAILFCLMLVVAVLQEMGIFQKIMTAITKKVHSARILRLVLVLVCFFSSMVITNDVALITFVPFGILLLDSIGRHKDLIYVISLQSIAANLGSMFTPIGNPQNVYLYSTYNMNMGEFILTMLPYTLVSLAGLVFGALIIPDSKVESVTIEKNYSKTHTWKYLIPAVLFVVCILCVLRVLDYRIMLILTIVGIVMWNYKLLVKADYMLLLTFIAFFVFVGNMKQIPQISNLLAKMMDGNEIMVSILSSQVISNVPAAVLLSGFADKGSELLVGVNIGGLGTLIASMASLISFKAYAAQKDAQKGKYLLVFTGLNIVFLGMMLLTMLIMQIL